MTTTREQKQSARALILTITRSGFTQLRKTNDGYLYGSGTFRFLLPYAAAQGSITADAMTELFNRFIEVRGQRDAEYGRFKPPVEEPVPNPEDLLHEDEGGPPDVGTEAMNLADAGSTPAPPATPNIAPTEGETTMAKWKCEKCGKSWKMAAHLGRHKKNCKGSGDLPIKIEVTRTKARRAPKALPVSNGSSSAIEAFVAASAALVEHMKSLETETKILHRENIELRTFKQRAEALFGPSPKVPRA